MMADKVFVECNWIIRSFEMQAFFEDYRTARSHQCALWITRGRFIENSYEIVPLFISADTQQQIDRFRHSIRYMEFLRCESVQVNSDELYSLDEIFSSGAPTSQSMLLLFLEEAGQHNQHVRDGLPLWAEMTWQGQAVEPEHMKQVLKIAEANRMSVYYAPDKFAFPPDINIYIKIEKHHEYNLRLDEIKQLMGIKSWHIMFSASIHAEPERTFEQIESYIKLNTDTLLAFVRLLEMLSMLGRE